jgi:hypothetical protein
MWERAYGAKPDACMSPNLKQTRAFFTAKVHRGAGWWSVIKTAGQPHRRLGQEFTYCSKGGPVTVNFTKGGKVSSVMAS